MCDDLISSNILDSTVLLSVAVADKFKNQLILDEHCTGNMHLRFEKCNISSYILGILAPQRGGDLLPDCINPLDINELYFR